MADFVERVFLFQLSGQVGLGQGAEVLVGERVELVLETARQHPFDLFLPWLHLDPAVREELLGPGDVLVVELDGRVTCLHPPPRTPAAGA